MKIIEVNTGVLAIEACYADSVDVSTLGVIVDFHPGIPRASRSMALESALRYWKQEVGSVTRGEAERRVGFLLSGWRIMVEGRGPVLQMRIAFSSTAEIEQEMAQDG
jgi:hypothetical protein